MNSYIEVPAYITDVEEYSERHLNSNTTSYRYTVHYIYDGEEYESEEKSDFSPDTNLSYVYMNPDTLDISTGSVGEYKLASYVFFAIAIGAFIASIITFIAIKA